MNCDEPGCDRTDTHTLHHSPADTGKERWWTSGGKSHRSKLYPKVGDSLDDWPEYKGTTREDYRAAERRNY